MNRELDECCRRSPKIGETNMSYKKPKKIKKIPNPKCEDGIRIDNELNMEYNEAIEKYDKYHEQEIAKQELLRVELEMKLKYMEQEVVRKDGIIEICWEHINGLQKFIELDNS